MNEARRARRVHGGAEMNEHIIMQGTTSPSLPHSLCLFPVYHHARLITCPHTEPLLFRLEGAKVGEVEGK